jgi:hypothetical protein
MRKFVDMHGRQPDAATLPPISKSSQHTDEKAHSHAMLLHVNPVPLSADTYTSIFPL